MYRRRKIGIESDFNELFILLRKLDVLSDTKGIFITYHAWLEIIQRWMDDGGRP